MLKKTFTRVISLAVGIFLLTASLPAFAEEGKVKIWDFNGFAVGERAVSEYPDEVFTDCEVAEYKNSKALKINAKGYNNIYRFRNLILGEYCVSFDIASEGGNFNGSVTSRTEVNSVKNLLLFKNGAVCLPSGNELPYRIGKNYTNIAICVNPQNKTFDLYINKRCVVKQAYIKYASDKNFLINFNFTATQSTEEIYLDNIVMHPSSVKTDRCFVYNKNGKYVPDDKSKLTDTPDRIYSYYHGNDNDVVKSVSNRNAIHMRSGLMTLHGEKERLTDMPYTENGEYMVPVQAVEKLLDITVTRDGESITAGDKAQLRIGEKEMTVNDGVKIAMDAAPAEKNGVLYLPLRALTEKAFSKFLYSDDTTTSAGMVIIGDVQYLPPVDSEELEKLNEYLLYERPSTERVLEDYKKSPNYGVHPRIMMTAEDAARLRREVVEDEVKKKWYGRLIEYCETIITDKNYFFARNGYCYPITGSMSNQTLQTIFAGFETHMLTLCLAYQLSGDVRYADGAWKEIETLLTFPDWEPSNHMAVAICGVGFAVAYDWLFDYLTPEQKSMMEKNVYDNNLWWANETYHITENSFDGVVNEQNHNIITNAGLILPALAFMDVYPELGAHIVSEAVRCLEYFIDKFAPNGALLDGPSYTQISVDYLSRTLSVLEMVLGNYYCLETTEGLDKITEYLQCVGSDVMSYNFGDSVGGKACSGGLFYLIDLYKQDGLRDLVAAEKRLNNNKDQMLVSSILWYDVNDESGKQGISLDGYYDSKGLAVVTARNKYGEGQVFAGMKAGTTDIAYHVHHDAGSFVFDALGVRWAWDLGADDYQVPNYLNLQGGRFNAFRTRPEAHNTLVINPGYDYNFVPYSFAPISVFESKTRGVKTVIDMSSVLANQASSAKRGFLFTDDRTSLVVRDEIDMPKTSEAQWLMYTKADTEVNGSTVVLSDKTDPAKKVMLEFASSVPGAVVVEDAAPMKSSPQIQGQNQNADYKRIIYKVTAEGKVNITARITPLEYLAGTIEEYNKPIDSWKIPDGECEEIPVLDKLTIGGTEYDVQQKSIVVSCETEDSPVLDIGAESGKYTVEVVKGENVSMPSYVYLAKQGEPDRKYRYIITYNPKVKKRYIDGYELADIKSAKASDEPQADTGFIAENVLDGDMNTRWTAERDQTMLLELLEPSVIDTFMMALYIGDTRTTAFDVYVSEDGEKFEQVYSGASSGKTSDYETYDIGSHKAKFIRVNFHGSSNSTWNNVEEIAVGRKAAK